MKNFPFIITISSEKGGVGKTTLATNLAIYLRAIREDLPVTIFSFDNHFTIDRMFQIKGQKHTGTVHEMLMGESAATLVHSGQYGVGYIPSSTELSDIHERFKGPMTLAQMMAESGLSGIVIIDTRPDLNILTQNALYAADRVLIPVKDMPSLENCKNIFALFDQRGIDKKSLALLPCLIDERIKFEGVFKDQKTLLRAFAANRGYRCMDAYISKSPKVESLNTNPDGKIYPVLTHARGTDVHSQFTEISRDILKSFDSTPEPRSCLYAQWISEKEGKKKATYLARLEGLSDHCLICGSPASQEFEPRGFYYETSDRAVRGFLHSECFADMLCGTLYGLYNDSQAHGAARSVIAEKAGKSVTVLYPRVRETEYLLDFRQFKGSGEQLLKKDIHLPGFAEGELNGLHDRLFLFLNESLSGYEGKIRDNCWLAIYPVDPANPEAILQDESYRFIKKFQVDMAGTLATS
jgi:cellulose biosynthesis protein BcsQ